MRVVFAGYRKWSYKILRRLIATKNSQWKIIGCITTENPEASFNSLSIPCFSLNPNTLDNTTVKRNIFKLKPDVFLFYGWSWMIPKKYFEKYPCIVLHPSPLPKYRGGSPLQNQIMHGEEKSAVTLFQVGENIDEGPIYSQQSFSLDGTLDDIFNRIIRVGTKLTKQTLSGLANHSLTPKPQDEKNATIYKRRGPKESEITIQDFKTKTAKEVYNKIRSLADPYPNAYIICKDGKKLYFKKADVEK